VLSQCGWTTSSRGTLTINDSSCQIACIAIQSIIPWMVCATVTHAMAGKLITSDDLSMCRRPNDAAVTTAKSATPEALLATLPLFHTCDVSFVAMIAASAEYLQLASGKELCLTKEHQLFIVQQGSVEMSAGRLPPRPLGCGEVLNLGVFLQGIACISDEQCLSEQATHEPCKAYKVNGYSGAPPVLFSERKRMLMLVDRRSAKKKSQLSDDQLCLYNLCPHASSIDPNMGQSRLGDFQWAVSASGSPWSLSSSITLREAAGQESQVQLMAIPVLHSLHSDPALFEHCSSEIRTSLDHYHLNSSAWSVYMRRCPDCVVLQCFQGHHQKHSGKLP